jgi:hypothetical protein
LRPPFAVQDDGRGNRRLPRSGAPKPVIFLQKYSCMMDGMFIAGIADFAAHGCGRPNQFYRSKQ